MNSADKQVWIGLFTLAPTVDNPEYGHYRGACVNVLALARNEVEFLEIVNEACSQMRFVIQEHEDAEPFAKRVAKYYVGQQLQELAEKVTNSSKVQFGNFHTFQHEDA